MQVIATHEVGDVQHWFNSPKRAEFFAEYGMTVTPFRDPEGKSTVTAVLIGTPDLEALQAALATEEAQQAQTHDGVHPDTISIFVAE